MLFLLVHYFVIYLDFFFFLDIFSENLGLLKEILNFFFQFGKNLGILAIHIPIFRWTLWIIYCTIVLWWYDM